MTAYKWKIFSRPAGKYQCTGAGKNKPKALRASASHYFLVFLTFFFLPQVIFMLIAVSSAVFTPATDPQKLSLHLSWPTSLVPDPMRCYSARKWSAFVPLLVILTPHNTNGMGRNLNNGGGFGVFRVLDTRKWLQGRYERQVKCLE